jgi:hypothetical protein
MSLSSSDDRGGGVVVWCCGGVVAWWCGGMVVEWKGSLLLALDEDPPTAATGSLTSSLLFDFFFFFFLGGGNVMGGQGIRRESVRKNGSSNRSSGFLSRDEQPLLYPHPQKWEMCDKMLRATLTEKNWKPPHANFVPWQLPPLLLNPQHMGCMR